VSVLNENIQSTKSPKNSITFFGVCALDSPPPVGGAVEADMDSKKLF